MPADGVLMSHLTMPDRNRSTGVGQPDEKHLLSHATFGVHLREAAPATTFMTTRFPSVVLPEGYNGKILLALVKASDIEDTVVLRSGDLWHREILRNTETEISRLGLNAVAVHELGGAWVRSHRDGGFIVFGGSDEYGACDTSLAAQLLQRQFPGRTIRVED